MNSNEMNHSRLLTGQKRFKFTSTFHDAHRLGRL